METDTRSPQPWGRPVAQVCCGESWEGQRAWQRGDKALCSQVADSGPWAPSRAPAVAPEAGDGGVGVGGEPDASRSPPAPGGSGNANPASGQPWGPRAPVLNARAWRKLSPGRGCGQDQLSGSTVSSSQTWNSLCFCPMLRTVPGLWQQEDTRNACWKWTRAGANACEHQQFRAKQERAAPASTSPGWPRHMPFSGASVSLTENNSIGFPTRCISNQALLSF